MLSVLWEPITGNSRISLIVLFLLLLPSCILDAIGTYRSPCDGDRDSDGDSTSDWDDEIDQICSTNDDCTDEFECTHDLCINFGCFNIPDDSLCTRYDFETCLPEAGCASVSWVDSECLYCGEGTEERPFSSITEALSQTSAQRTLNLIRVRAGKYEEDSFKYHSSVPLLIDAEHGVEWNSKADVAFTASAMSHVTIRGVTIKAKSYAVVCEELATCVLERVALSQCGNAGLKSTGAANVWIHRSMIDDNEQVGLRLDASSEVHMFNSFVIRNGGKKAEAGGLWILNDEVEVELMNCTIADNRSSKQAGAIRSVSAINGSLKNLIIWHNSTNDFGEECERCLLGSDSLVQIDPLFVGSKSRYSAEDYMITENSPARDRGILLFAVDAVDYFGSLRIDLGFDTGAHEYQEDYKCRENL